MIFDHYCCMVLLMERQIEKELDIWRHKKRRKPLLLRGARQVGKTYIVRQFGRKFQRYTEINFELTKDAEDIFKADLKPDRIIRDLALLTKSQTILPLFFGHFFGCFGGHFRGLVLIIKT